MIYRDQHQEESSAISFEHGTELIPIQRACLCDGDMIHRVEFQNEIQSVTPKYPVSFSTSFQEATGFGGEDDFQGFLNGFDGTIVTFVLPLDLRARSSLSLVVNTSSFSLARLDFCHQSAASFGRCTYSTRQTFTLSVVIYDSAKKPGSSSIHFARSVGGEKEGREKGEVAGSSWFRW